MPSQVTPEPNDSTTLRTKTARSRSASLNRSQEGKQHRVDCAAVEEPPTQTSASESAPDPPLLQCLQKDPKQQYWQTVFAYAGTTRIFTSSTEAGILGRRYVKPPAGVRERVAALRPVLGTDRVVVISGASGGGKTDLAITAPHHGPGTLVVVYVVSTDLAESMGAVKKPHRTATEAAVRVVGSYLGFHCDGLHEAWRQGNGSVHLRVVFDEMGSYTEHGHAVIAEQYAICDQLRSAFDLHSASLVLVGTGMDGPLATAGTPSADFTALRIDDVAFGFEEAFKACLSEPSPAFADFQPGGVTTATVHALLRNPRMGSLLIQYLSRTTDRLHYMPSPTPVARKDAPVTALRKALEQRVLGAIANFRNLNAMNSLSASEMREALCDAVAIETGAYDSAGEYLYTYRARYGCITDRAVSIARGAVTAADGSGAITAGSVVTAVAQQQGDALTAYRVLEADEAALVVVPLDSFGRYRVPLASRAMFLALAGACGIDDVAAPRDVERITALWASVLPLLTTPEHTVQQLVALQCTPGAPAASGVDAWRGLRPGKPFTGRNAVTSVVNCASGLEEPQPSAPSATRDDDSSPSSESAAGVYLRGLKDVLAVDAGAAMPGPQVATGAAKLSELFADRAQRSVPKQRYNYSYGYSVVLPVEKHPAVCLLNAGVLPGAEDVHLRVTAHEKRTAETVVLKVQPGSEPVDASVMLHALSGAGLRCAASEQPPFCNEVPSLEGTADETARTTFALVAVTGAPATDRSVGWPAVCRLNLQEGDAEQRGRASAAGKGAKRSTKQSKKGTKPKGPSSSGGSGAHVMVAVHRCTVDGQGRLQTAAEGTRPFAFPLLLPAVVAL